MIGTIQETGVEVVGGVKAMGGVEAFFRWGHVLAGVLWIGLLYFFNWVNSAFAPTMDAETKQKVVPELMPRALYFFRWGAAWTWIFGVMLLFIVYYVGPYMMADGTKPELGSWLPAFLGLFVGFLVYDILFKTLGKTQHAVAAVIWGLIAVAFAGYMIHGLDASVRAAYIHVGALFGTAMAANVWMRIWPAQKRIITAIKNGDKPNPDDVGLAGLRSKHNTYMSVPLLLLMVSVHLSWVLGNFDYWSFLPVILIIGYFVTKMIYAKAAKVPGF